MARKVLFCASSFQHIRNFHLPYLKQFRERGFEVWVAANGDGDIPEADHLVKIPFFKSFFSVHNLQAVLRLRKLLTEHDFELISTHTTLASAVIRLAVLSVKRGSRPKVAVTSHGYLFHEADMLKKWAYLIPEKICSPATDVLMVMNGEDLETARRHRLSRGPVYFIKGMGISAEKFRDSGRESREEMRARLGFGREEFLMVFAAEFSRRKNQASLIRAFAACCARMPDAYLLLAGEGALRLECERAAAETAPGRVKFLGHVDRMEALYPACDAAVTSSLLEGLPFNVMEAMQCGIPVIARDTKGHRDLIQDGVNGLLYRREDELAEKMCLLYRDRALGKRLADEAEKTVNTYTLDCVLPDIMAVYDTVEKKGTEPVLS